MKKIIATMLAGVMSLSAVACLAACGGDDEVADREAPAYADGEWGAKVDLTELSTGNGSDISPDLFGLFLEDINYASFALDDNLIVNGSFETVASATANGKEHGWTESGATIAVKSGDGALHKNNQNFAEIVSTAGGKISNAGHKEVPIAVESGVEYKFSMFIKGYAGDVTVRVKDNASTYAEGTFTVAGSDTWTKYIKTIKADTTIAEGLTMEIAFSAADTFDVDSVKLETADATSFGMKNYLYEAIENLGPKFFRFPGGCVIEGTNINEAYDWKNSIGAAVTGTNAGDDDVEAFTYPVNDNGTTSTVTTYGEQATRKQNVNIWQANKTANDYYDHEYGLGFYEYFCLCDALGAKAIPIVNCGYSCQTQGTGTALAGRHGKKVDDYIQDAIDLLEFAKGATSTKWGKIREQMGHPEPFEMDYIGIGNEQWGDYYQGYYEKFLKSEAFKKAMKDYNVRPIVGNCTMFEHCENSDGKGREGLAQGTAKSAKNIRNVVDTVAEYGVHDQHYYVNYTDFFLNTKMYDSYTRSYEDAENYYDVFVGEYAANDNRIRSPKADDNTLYNQTKGSMITALSEAAMMTGFERNGDIVKLAAYAPMFGVANTGTGAQTADGTNNQWAVDMMYFTNTDVVLTPNYFVQQLFMHNAGTQKVKSELAFASGKSMPTTTVKQSNGKNERTYDNFYYVTSYNEETKNLIVKIVNAGDTAMKFNINVDVDKSLTGIAQVNEIAADGPNAVSTYAKGNAITPFAEKIGFSNGSFGYAVKPYSVVAFQIRVK